MADNLEKLRAIAARLVPALHALEETDLTQEQRAMVTAIHDDALRAAYVAADELGVEVSEIVPPEGLRRDGQDKEPPPDPPPGGGG